MDRDQRRHGDKHSLRDDRLRGRGKRALCRERILADVHHVVQEGRHRGARRIPIRRDGDLCLCDGAGGGAEHRDGGAVRKVWLPPKLIPVFQGEARYRGAYGGRGSGKTRSFAKMAAVKGLQFGAEGREGIILCGREFMNSLDDSSLEELKHAIREHDWLEAYYEVGEKFIRSKDGKIRFVFAGLRRNVDSIKSKARILLAWVDEAET